MKYCRVVLAALVLFVVLWPASVGCIGYPPAYPILDPVIAHDAQGNVFVAYQVGDHDTTRGKLAAAPDTYVQKLGPSGERLWGKKGVRLDREQPQVGRIAVPRLVADGYGNVTAFWSYGGQFFAEKLDGDGDRVWRAGPFAVGPGCVAEYHEGVGTWVGWIDADGGLRSLMLGEDGSLLRREEQPQIADVAGFAAMCDERGDTWVVWVETGTGAINLQAFDQSGAVVWSETTTLQEGDPSGQIPEASGYRLDVAPNGFGGAVVFWTHGWSSPQTRICGIDAAGKTLWTRAAPSLSSIDGDGEGGVFLFVSDGQSLSAHHVDPQGTELWGPNGLYLGETGADDSTVSEPNLYARSDHAGGIVVLREGDAATCHVQRIGAAGNEVWPAEGVAMDSGFLQSIVLGSDAATYFAVADRWTGESWVQKVDSGGALLWGASGIRLDDWR